MSYFEKDGYYAKAGPAHHEASARAGNGAAALGQAGPVEPEAFQRVRVVSRIFCNLVTAPDEFVAGMPWCGAITRKRQGRPGRRQAAFFRAAAPTRSDTGFSCAPENQTADE